MVHLTQCLTCFLLAYTLSLFCLTNWSQGHGEIPLSAKLNRHNASSRQQLETSRTTLCSNNINTSTWRYSWLVFPSYIIMACQTTPSILKRDTWFTVRVPNQQRSYFKELLAPPHNLYDGTAGGFQIVPDYIHLHLLSLSRRTTWQVISFGPTGFYGRRMGQKVCYRAWDQVVFSHPGGAKTYNVARKKVRV